MKKFVLLFGIVATVINPLAQAEQLQFNATDRTEIYWDQKGNRIENHMDRKDDRFNQRMEQYGEQAKYKHQHQYQHRHNIQTQQVGRGGGQGR